MRKLINLSLIAISCALAGCGSSDDPEKNIVNPTASAAPDPSAPPPAKKNMNFGGSSKGASGFGNN